jgi:hypothetical protein
MLSISVVNWFLNNAASDNETTRSTVVLPPLRYWEINLILCPRYPSLIGSLIMPSQITKRHDRLWCYHFCDTGKRTVYPGFPSLNGSLIMSRRITKRHDRLWCWFIDWVRWGEITSPDDTSLESDGGMILTGNPKNSEKNVSQYHFFHHKFHIDWPGLEPGLLLWEAGD